MRKSNQKYVLDFIRTEYVEGRNKTDIYDFISKKLNMDINEIEKIINKLLKDKIIQKVKFTSYSTNTQTTSSGIRLYLIKKHVQKRYEKRAKKPKIIRKRIKSAIKPIKGQIPLKSQKRSIKRAIQPIKRQIPLKSRKPIRFTSEDMRPPFQGGPCSCNVTPYRTPIGDMRDGSRSTLCKCPICGKVWRE